MGEHLLSGKPIASAACRTDRFHRPINRVQRRVRVSTEWASICPLAGRSPAPRAGL